MCFGSLVVILYSKIEAGDLGSHAHSPFNPQMHTHLFSCPYKILTLDSFAFFHAGIQHDK